MVRSIGALEHPFAPLSHAKQTRRRLQRRFPKRAAPVMDSTIPSSIRCNTRCAITARFLRRRKSNGSPRGTTRAFRLRHPANYRSALPKRPANRLFRAFLVVSALSGFLASRRKPFGRSVCSCGELFAIQLALFSASYWNSRTPHLQHWQSQPGIFRGISATPPTVRPPPAGDPVTPAMRRLH